jgi:hypothetical protein
MGYITPSFLASEEFVRGIIPLKIPPTLKYSTIWRNILCMDEKNFLKKSSKQIPHHTKY